MSGIGQGGREPARVTQGGTCPARARHVPAAKSLNRLPVAQMGALSDLDVVTWLGAVRRRLRCMIARDPGVFGARGAPPNKAWDTPPRAPNTPGSRAWVDSASVPT